MHNPFNLLYHWLRLVWARLQCVIIVLIATLIFCLLALYVDIHYPLPIETRENYYLIDKHPWSRYLLLWLIITGLGIFYIGGFAALVIDIYRWFRPLSMLGKFGFLFIAASIHFLTVTFFIGILLMKITFSGLSL